MDKASKQAIYKAILHDEWLLVQYRNKDGKTTTYYAGVRSFDLPHDLVIADVYNPEKSFEAILESCRLSLSRIETAIEVKQSHFPAASDLLEELEGDHELQKFLEADTLDNDILSYLRECVHNDENPYVQKHVLLPGVDYAELIAQPDLPLSDENFKKLIDLLFHLNSKSIEDIDAQSATLAFNLLSIDKGENRFVVAYRLVRLNFKTRSLHISPTTSVNKQFLIGAKDSRSKGVLVSLSEYLDVPSEIFVDTFDEHRREYTDMIAANLHNGGIIDTEPMLFRLNRANTFGVEQAFQAIREAEEKGALTFPLKSFFGKNRCGTGTSKEVNIVIFDKAKINIDQLRVVYNAMTNHVTYVQGPPGTGKTETIFNVLLSAYANEKKILICSNNNHPLDDIYAKMAGAFPFLESRKLRFPIVRLRSSSRADASQTIGELRAFFEMSDRVKTWTSNDAKTEQSKTLSMKGYDELRAALMRYEEMQRLQDEYHRLSEIAEMTSAPKLHEETLRQRDLRKAELEKQGTLRNEDITPLAMSAQDNKDFQAFVIFSVISRLKRLSSPTFKELRSIVFSDEEGTMKELSRYLRSPENLRRFLNVFPMVVATNMYAANLGEATPSFDLCVMDEAAQCNIAYSLIPLVRCRDCLLVGDVNQLQPVTILDAGLNAHLLAEYGVSPDYDYIDNSILSTMLKKDPISKSILLRYHYRCGKLIANFVNQRFYGNQLCLANAVPGSLSFVDVQNSRLANRRNAYWEEAEAIAQLVQDNHYEDAAIITPFVAQKDLINACLRKRGITNVEAGTIHTLQGSEKSTIILSTAICPLTGEKTMSWLKNNHELINVAVTRAKQSLIVFGDKTAIEKLTDGEETDLGALCSYVSSKGSYVVPSSPLSIISDYSNHSSAEAEFFEVISVYFNKARNKFRIERNVPVREALKGIAEEEEKAFGRKEFDVVVSVSTSLFGSRYMPKVIFEIDGGEHIGSKRSAALDREKENICRRYGIKVIRIANSQVRDYELIIRVFEKVAKGAQEAEEAEAITLFDSFEATASSDSFYGG